MGLQSLTNRATFVGDGSSTIFPFPYYFFSKNDLAVYLFDNGSSVIYPQTLNTNYTIGGAVNQQGVYPTGGTVIMASSVPTNLDIVITRSPAMVQTFTLNQNGPINALALTQQLDYVTALIQRLQDEVSRCVQIPDGMGPFNGSTFSTVLPTGVCVPANGGFPLVLNSGATGFTLGLITTGQSGSISYSGLLPIQFGGTGQGSPAGPNLALVGVTSSTSTWSQISIGSGAVISNGVSGILPTANGGTGVPSVYPQYSMIYASSTTQFGAISSALAGLAMVANGSAAPSFQQMSLGSSSAFVGVLPIANGGTAAATANAGFVNLSPMTSRGDIIICGSSGVQKRLAAGADGLFLQANSVSFTDGVGYVSATNAGAAITSKNNTYIATTADQIILCSNASFFLTLYTATGNTGKSITIKKIDSNLANAISIVGTSAQTIDGISGAINLSTGGESYTLFNDGSNWWTQDHRWFAGENSYAPVFSGFSAPSGGTSAIWIRNGTNLVGWVKFACGNTSGSTASVSLPAGLIASANIGTPQIVGSYIPSLVGAAFYPTIISPGASVVNFGVASSGANGFTAIPGTGIGGFGSSVQMTLTFNVPISGWNG